MAPRRSEHNLEKALKRKVEEGLICLGCRFLMRHRQVLQTSILLKRWSRAFNLSGIKDLNEMVVKHV